MLNINLSAEFVLPSVRALSASSLALVAVPRCINSQTFFALAVQHRERFQHAILLCNSDRSMILIQNLFKIQMFV